MTILLSELLPEFVSCHEAYDDKQAVELFHDEQIFIAPAAQCRKEEFATSRRCARMALAGIGLPSTSLVPDKDRVPVWPSGVVGSITHCSGYRGVAVTRCVHAIGIGIDAEPHEAFPDGIAATTFSPQECKHFADLARKDSTLFWETIAFSAKEAFYKAWFPITRLWLDFTDVGVHLEPESKSFTTTLLTHERPLAWQYGDQFEGRWLVRNGIIVTALLLSQPTMGTNAAMTTRS